MRGEKGSLFEGGIRVPMFAYWKGRIIPGTVIEEMVTTLGPHRDDAQSRRWSDPG